MFRFSMHGGHDRGCGPRGGRGEFDPERFFHWVERMGAGERERERGRGGGGRRRMFDGGELRLVLLRLIADEPRHGYDLIRAIEAMTGGAYAPSPGVVYPSITMLDDMGLIDEQQSDGAKKRFAATEAGRAYLAERADEVAALIARLTAIGDHRDRVDRGPVRRSMRNLRTVLQNRLEAGDLSDEDGHRVAALIDEVVQKIERL